MTVPQWLASGKPFINGVPVGDIGFGFFPAEKNLASIQLCREVDEPALRILQLNITRMKFPKQIMELAEVADKCDRCGSAKIFARGQSRPEHFFGLAYTRPYGVHLRKPSTNSGEQFAGFSQSVMPGKLERHCGQGSCFSTA